MHKIFFLTSILFISACTWVKLTPEGQDVILSLEDEILNCQLKGQTTVSLKSKVAGIKRDREQVKSELSILARNSAVNIGGDTIVSASDVENGQQTFNVYVCNKIIK